MAKAIACVFAAFVTRRASADAGQLTPIATDRPAVTDSSVVVPEPATRECFCRNFEPSAAHLRRPETIGVASKTELRLIAPDYFGTVRLGSGFVT